MCVNKSLPVFELPSSSRVLGGEKALGINTLTLTVTFRDIVRKWSGDAVAGKMLELGAFGKF